MDKQQKVYLDIFLSKLPGKPDRSAGGRFIASREFHVSRKVREYYEFEASMFSTNGNVIFADFHSVRIFAYKMNQKKDLVNFPEQAARAGDLNAMGLIDEILHHVVKQYSRQKLAAPFQNALAHLYETVGYREVERTLKRFVEMFPPVDVYTGKKDVDEYLDSYTEGESNRGIVLEEILMLWLANENPAYARYKELFDDTELKEVSSYSKMIEGIHNFFIGQPGFGPGGEGLIDMLRAPAQASPDSLAGQLRFIKERWGMMFGQFLFKLLSSLDMIQEEEKVRFGGAPGPARVYEYGGAEEEAERFSPDLDWMPKVVLIAKSTLVWLDQLSKKYGRPIRTLDQIPDEEIDILASRGFTGLWLIGLWERSKASKRVKQMCGNPEAEASAYSLHDYEIAYELGGWHALEQLRERCWRKGVRLASDMVPNHTGIDSRWILHHPDWFIQLDHPPFPGYTYTGENLSGSSDVGVYLEDHYFDRTDAAVTFKWVDFHTGHTRYIYHGNDGTHMPWNDTAQLNYLKQEVREAVIQTILHVARNFPIIRFDAAMTLAKRHVQRLWFPEPGSGGDIASRAEHGLTKEQFDQAMPEEFWREVVDRVAQEVPDTLLLAEAFWMMESYFVRTLGMHRVYNSAFMHMMKNEDNEKYRLTVKKTLEFDPEILKRFVNFMNNPDEETAVNMFGKGDKYFGVCTLMLTMPGLPMIGHGQIEGFAEKYGMEYRKAYWKEEPDQELVHRHERELFPLMKKRYLFAGVENFMLYDLYSENGSVNENVYAYSNRVGEETALVFFNNSLNGASGWVKVSAAFSDKTADRQLRQRVLGENLALRNEADFFVLLREHVSGQWFIRESSDLWNNGLFVHLQGYQYQVFFDIREVQDDSAGHYRKLYTMLNGAGVPDIDEAMKEIYLQPLLEAFHRALEPDVFHAFQEAVSGKEELPEKLEKVLVKRYDRFLDAARHFSDGDAESSAEPCEEFRSHLKAAFEVLAALNRTEPDILSLTTEVAAGLSGRASSKAPGTKRVYASLQEIQEEEPLKDSLSHILLAWLFFRNLGPAISKEYSESESISLLNQWLLEKRIRGLFRDLGMSDSDSERAVRLLKILISHQYWFSANGERRKKILPDEVLRNFLSDTEISAYLGENRYEDVLWFNRESFRSLVFWLYTLALIQMAEKGLRKEKTAANSLKDVVSSVDLWLVSVDASNYRVDRLLEAVRPKGKKPAKPSSPKGKPSSTGGAKG